MAAWWESPTGGDVASLGAYAGEVTVADLLIYTDMALRNRASLFTLCTLGEEAETDPVVLLWRPESSLESALAAKGEKPLGPISLFRARLQQKIH